MIVIFLAWIAENKSPLCKSYHDCDFVVDICIARIIWILIAHFLFVEEKKAFLGTISDLSDFKEKYLGPPEIAWFAIRGAVAARREQSGARGVQESLPPG